MAGFLYFASCWHLSVGRKVTKCLFLRRSQTVAILRSTSKLARAHPLLTLNNNSIVRQVPSPPPCACSTCFGTTFLFHLCRSQVPCIYALLLINSSVVCKSWHCSGKVTTKLLVGLKLASYQTLSRRCASLGLPDPCSANLKLFSKSCGGRF